MMMHHRQRLSTQISYYASHNIIFNDKMIIISPPKRIHRPPVRYYPLPTLLVVIELDHRWEKKKFQKKR